MGNEEPVSTLLPENKQPRQNFEHDLFVCRTTIAHYAVALDSRDWAMLENVFAPDVRANYTAIRPDIGDVRDRSALIQKLREAVNGKDTQHALTTQLMDSMDPDLCRIRTYFTANTFSMEDGKFKHTTQHGFYGDTLKPDGMGGWHIVARDVVRLGPRIINNSTPAEGQ